MLAGLFAGLVLPSHGWRALFFIGGSLPLVLSVLLVLGLPESPRFLVRHPTRRAELSRLLARMSRPSAANAAFKDRVEQSAEQRGGVSALFRDGLARDTVAIWCAFF